MNMLRASGTDRGVLGDGPAEPPWATATAPVAKCESTSSAIMCGFPRTEVIAELRASKT
jgi:hypothetical protein